MDDIQLKAALNRIGKACFVKYLEDFSDDGKSTEELVEKLMAEENYAETASKTRVTNSRMIINSGRVEDALEIIISSKRLSPRVIEKAKKHFGNA